MGTCTPAQRRQQQQQAFIQSQQNIVIGDVAACPLSLAQLQLLRPTDPCVIQFIDSGLTAQVFHIRLEGKDFCIKRARNTSLVQNIDGQLAFLNEIQCRERLQALKSDRHSSAAFTHIVTTLYANYQEGIIVSPWFTGRPLSSFSREVFKQLCASLFALEQAGLMEWDLSPGNILYDGRHIQLFDFGYMYPFDPLSEYNSDGLSAPQFHTIERFETRSLFGFLLRYQSSMTQHDRLSIYREWKECALDYYTQKRWWLRQHFAKPQVIAWITALISQWEQALDDESCLLAQFESDAFRSYCLDIEDDISGRSCTPDTLAKLDHVICCLEKDSNKNAQALLKYQQLREQALAFQLKG